jgi:Na+-driven multidrug efflux pump
MQIIWGILLIPLLAYAEVCKAALSQLHSSSKIKSALLNMLLITFFMTSIFFLTTPLWSSIANFFNDDLKLVETSSHIYKILLPGYFLLSFSLITDSLFYAIGRPKYIAIQAIIVNCLVYLPAYILYANDSWQPSMDSVMWLFVIGLICNTLVSIPLVWLAVSEKHKALT